ncbi:MAG: glycine cleavage T C-terminal barrel domain-containing protein, partial [Bacteroidales bacterium]|nr:glycine cleavage T C-terminal barrel domain-containing protein [Bacteroidales bacterium]
KEDKPSKNLKPFVMIDRGIPRQHYLVYDADDNEIGEVTSGTMSPMMKIGIGMAYLKAGYGKPGSEIFIGVRNKKLKAEVVKSPIFKGQIPAVK